jgi:hypothetical protein
VKSTYSQPFVSLTQYNFFVQMQLADMNVAMDNQRSQFNALEKKQRKFDQNLAEEKAISERFHSAIVFLLANAVKFTPELNYQRFKQKLTESLKNFDLSFLSSVV